MKKIHYAWFVCIGCALLLFCTSGLSINAFTVYQPYILSVNGFTNTQASTLITVRSLFSFVSMLLTGVYYKRISLRHGMGIAGLLNVAAFAVFGLAKAYPVYCLAAALVGLSYGFGTMVPIAIVLEHWFIEKRTLALSICSAGTGLSTLGIPNLLTWLIEQYSLKTAFFVHAAVVAVLAGGSFLLIRDNPQKKGLSAYGEEAQQNAKIKAPPTKNLQKKDWLVWFVMLLLLGAMTNVGYSHLTVLVSSEGFSSHLTALSVTVSGVSLTIGKCIYGIVADKIGTYKCNYLFAVILLGGMVGCCLVNDSAIGLMLAMASYGVGLSLTTVGLTAWAGDLSTPGQYDSTVRRFQLGYAAGGLVFSSLPGILADRFDGSYKPAYIFFVFCTVCVVLCVQLTCHRFQTDEKKIKSGIR